MSSCEEHLKNAKRATAWLGGDWWEAASQFRLAAECFENHQKLRKAVYAYKQACRAFRKYKRDERLSREGQVETSTRGIRCLARLDEKRRDKKALKYFRNILTSLLAPALRDMLEVLKYRQSISLIEAALTAAYLADDKAQTRKYAGQLAILYRDYSKLLGARKKPDQALKVLTKAIKMLAPLTDRAALEQLAELYLQHLITKTEALIATGDCQGAATTLQTRLQAYAQLPAQHALAPRQALFLKQLITRAQTLKRQCRGHIQAVIDTFQTTTASLPTTQTTPTIKDSIATLDDRIDSLTRADLEAEIHALEAAIEALERKFADGLIGTPEYTRTLRGYNKALYKLQNQLEEN